ncbi:hypothetical protein H9L39_16779 [Fusarium oxysporum f. sp. albedinis]|nr:hypothetical protein H9L39_16779 [Fusarium oxysporum f. sp. albedinis]
MSSRCLIKPFYQRYGIEPHFERVACSWDRNGGNVDDIQSPEPISRTFEKGVAILVIKARNCLLLKGSRISCYSCDIRQKFEGLDIQFVIIGSGTGRIAATRNTITMQHGEYFDSYMNQHRNKLRSAAATPEKYYY